MPPIKSYRKIRQDKMHKLPEAKHCKTESCSLHHSYIIISVLYIGVDTTIREDKLAA